MSASISESESDNILHINPGALALKPRFLAEWIPSTVVIMVPASSTAIRSGDTCMALVNAEKIVLRNGANTEIDIKITIIIVIIPATLFRLVFLTSGNSLRLNITPLSSTIVSFLAMPEISVA